MDHKSEILSMVEIISGSEEGPEMLYKLYQLMRRFMRAYSPQKEKEISPSEALRLDCHALLKDIPSEALPYIHDTLAAVIASSKVGRSPRLQ